MKYLLVAINAKYIHSNPAVYSLKEYAIANIPENVDYELKVCEYTINNQIDDILTDIYENAPDVIAFSCYIWNISNCVFLQAVNSWIRMYVFGIYGH